MGKNLAFAPDDYVVYPSHGVGRITAIETQEIVGDMLEMYVVSFEQDRLILRVPVAKAPKSGMRKLSSRDKIQTAMNALKARPRPRRAVMWSRRAQEYEAKINSGDLIAIAEVVRDLYRSETQPEQSYSERQLYEAALDRMAREIAAVEKLDERGAMQRITEVLSKSAKGRRMAEETTSGAEIKAA
jgi:CarD family transcriptional regulator, regulator of rRNA transcription